MNKKKKVRHSGKLKSYMQWPAVVAVLLVMLDILVFAIDVKAGFLVFCFTARHRTQGRPCKWAHWSVDFLHITDY